MSGCLLEAERTGKRKKQSVVGWPLSPREEGWLVVSSSYSVVCWVATTRFAGEGLLLTLPCLVLCPQEEGSLSLSGDFPPTVHSQDIPVLAFGPRVEGCRRSLVATSLFSRGRLSNTCSTTTLVLSLVDQTTPTVALAVLHHQHVEGGSAHSGTVSVAHWYVENY